MRLSRILALTYLGIALLVTIATVALGPLGFAPFPLVIAREPITITVAYSTEKEQWLKEATQRFNLSEQRIGGRPIAVQLTALGSGEMIDQLARGTLKATAISPASSLWIDRLAAQQPNLLADRGRPLVLTPLVVVAWDSRAATIWPNGADDLWNTLHTAIVRSYTASEQPPQYVNIGHTSPTTSNSGLQTLILLADAFHQGGGELTAQTVGDPAFAQWLREFEVGVPRVAESTAPLMSEMITRGPSQYDAVIVYENLALEQLRNAQRWGKLRILYPPTTILSDHPLAIVGAPGISAEQQRAAATFRDFLLSSEMQQLARQSGFRPVDPNMRIDERVANNPFTEFGTIGGRLDLPPQIPPPPVETIDALLGVWQTTTHR